MVATHREKAEKISLINNSTNGHTSQKVYMNTEERIQPFVKLFEYLTTLPEAEFQSLALNVANENPWFTEVNVRSAVAGITNFIAAQTLTEWIKPYRFQETPKTVALVLAGNIPLVGFHDFLAVLIAGHHAQLKLSSKDSVLMKFVIEKLIEFEPRLKSKIEITERLHDFNAVIATGSDNSSRYFEYYFGKYPHVIRKNRTSVAVLTGDETKEELNALGNDVFNYFGLGCRSVSKLFVPQGYKFDPLFESWESFKNVIHHHKYCNNYDYQKSLLLINRVPFLDNGFVMIQESDRIVSPISVVFYEYYQNAQQLKSRLDALADKIQVIVGMDEPATVPLGKSQQPRVCDYADNIDTLAFLNSF
jgi:hypothetical protein